MDEQWSEQPNTANNQAMIEAEPRTAIVEKDPSTSFMRMLRTVERTAGAFFAFVVGLVVFIAGGAVAIEGFDEEIPLLTRIVAGAIVIAEGVFLLWLKSGLEMELHPFVPQFSMRQPRWPLLLRPLMAAWWCAHLTVAIAAQYGLEQLIDLNSSADDFWLGLLMLLVGVWALSHCSLLYLYLAISSLYKRETILFALWRWRLAIDLAVAIGLLWASRFAGR